MADSGGDFDVTLAELSDGRALEQKQRRAEKLRARRDRVRREKREAKERGEKYVPRHGRPYAAMPEDAFATFVQLGAQRSYQALAVRIGISAERIKKLSRREGWMALAKEIDKERREAYLRAYKQDLELIGDRQSRVLRGLLAKVSQSIAGADMAKPKDLLRALEIAIKGELKLVEAKRDIDSERRMDLERLRQRAGGDKVAKGLPAPAVPRAIGSRARDVATAKAWLHEVEVLPGPPDANGHAEQAQTEDGGGV